MDSLASGTASPPISRWWSEHRTISLALIYGAVAVLLAVPMLIVTVPLGADDLNHLARIYVRAHIATDPDLERLFQLNSELTPYAGMDFVLTPLARVLPIMVAARIYIVALVWGLVGAVVVLQRAFTGRIGIAPAAAGLIAYNGLLAWGLLTYLLGMILALLLFATWHSYRARPWWFRLIFFSGAATVLYVTHVLAFVLYGVMVASYELFARPRPWRTAPRDWVVAAGQAIPALMMWRSLSMWHSLGTRIAGQSAFTYMANFKLFAIVAPIAFSGAVGGFLDFGVVVLIYGGLVWFLAPWRGWPIWPRGLAAPALVMLVLTLVMPLSFMGVGLFDYRFTVPAACLLLAGLRPKYFDLRRAVAAGVAVGVCMVAHIADVSQVMHRCDLQYAELSRGLQSLPRGAVVETVLERSAPEPGAKCTTLPIYNHIASLVTIERSGAAPDFFALVTSVNARGGRQTDTEPVSADQFTKAPAGGYVLWFHFGHRRPVPRGLTLLWRGSFFDVWSAVSGKAL